MPEIAKSLGLKTIIVAGIKNARTLSADDVDFIHLLGADCYSFNVVPTMLVAAHAGWKILAVVGPDSQGWQNSVIENIRKLNSQLEESIS